MFALFLVACGLSVYLLTGGLPPKEVSEEEQLPEDVTLVKFVMTNFQFDKEEYRVKQGEKVLLRVQNSNGVHGVAIEGMDIDLQGDQLEQEVVFDQPGEYKLYCSVMCGPGHGGMVAKLIVE
jgi:cytochrome c oxidase subunit 2